MSGGTWDYADRRLCDLADELRAGRARWHDIYDEGSLDLPFARGAIAGVLDVAATLLHQLDYHFAGDSLISDEQTWLTAAEQCLQAALIPFTSSISPESS